jgi:hypothetical protein
MLKIETTKKPARLQRIVLIHRATSFFLLLVGSDFWYCGHCWPTIPAPDDRRWWLWRNWWNEDWQGELKYSEKTCPSDTLSTTNPTWLNPDLSQSRRDGKPATNRLNYGAARATSYSHCPSRISEWIWKGRTHIDTDFCIIFWLKKKNTRTLESSVAFVDYVKFL